MSIRDALHLPPHTRGARRSETNSHDGNDRALDRDRLPIHPASGNPIPPRAQVGYYHGFSTLSQQAFWDEATRRVVLDRVQHIPPIRFFTPEEAHLMQVVVDRVLPQDDRDDAHKIAILNYIDDRLVCGKRDGYRFEDMPDDGEAHRLGLQAIAAIAQAMFGTRFEELGPQQQDRVLQSIHDGDAPAADDIWQRMSIKHYWLLLVQDCVSAYYAHPYAWDEIGFGGPAYPRGYMRLDNGQPEPWEVDERRYEWAPPPSALSNAYTDLDHETPLEQQFGAGGRGGGTPGQSGTH